MSTLYKAGRPYDHRPQAPHNGESFEKVLTELASGPRMRGTLESAVYGHPRPGGPHGFISYLIRRGWLVKA